MIIHLLQLGALAVFIRQTNIIWALFVACIGIIDCTLACREASMQVENSELSVGKDKQLASNKAVTRESNLRRRRSGNTVDAVSRSVQRTSASMAYSPGSFHELLVHCTLT